MQDKRAKRNKMLQSKRKPSTTRRLIGAIDQGTSSTRFLVFENETGQLLASSQIEVKRIVPQEGWVEMDPDAIMKSVNETIADVCRKLDRCSSPELEQAGQSYESAGSGLIKQISCIGICNQRESTVVWDSVSGKALYNVIVWMDNRTKDLVDQMIDATPGRDFNFLKDKTGLPMSTYFSAFKLKWLVDNVPEVKQALAQNRLKFGTVDSWILYNLTGEHLTDVTNASRTFLMDIETLTWDKQLCKHFNVPARILPRILASADDFGTILHGPLKGLPITGVIGDQSAALFGHNCLQLGQTKATFGTGCFIMQNIGPGPLNGALSGVQRAAKRGLVTTIGYKLRDRPACYALEGSIKIAGAALTWMRDNMQLIKNYDECDQLVNKTTNSAGVFFVPALGGLYSPYWDPNAAGLFIGLSQFTRREHLIRATFDSIAFQTNDILSLMRGVTNGLMIDGGLCKSDNMCQILADITGYEIARPSMCETSALGAAMVAGCGAGIWRYDDMLANSNTPYEYTSSANQNHHYPHASLHYQDKFSSLIQSKLPTTTRSTSNQLGRTSASNSDAGGGGVNDDAGGGRTATNQLAPNPPLVNNQDDDDGDDEISQCVSSDTEEDDITGTCTTSGEFTASSQDGLPAPGTLSLKESHAHLRSHHTPSSGYCSGDNMDFLSSTCNGQVTRRESPVSSSQIMDCSPPSEALSDAAKDNQTRADESHQVGNTLVGSFITQTFPSDLSTCLRNYICPAKPAISSLGDIQADESSDNADLVAVNQEDGYNSSASFCSAQLARSNLMISKPVDVFQSYISCEHRTELVSTWQLAVERSMKWTKIQHEEIRRIDYQRLSSLPISMFCFFSVGMIALSGLLSLGRGFVTS